MVFASGLRVGKYELGRPLGRGGFGSVFVARDTALDREVALKFLHPEHTNDPKILQRFLLEARATAKIAHPGIVTIHELGTVADTGTRADGTVYIAMELLHGESLTRRLARSRRFVPEAAMEVCRQVASALESAHVAGIVHRDLKPDNIYLVRDPTMPGGERVKVLDFGIAKLQADVQQTGQTSSMMVFGTPRYMSPEQCKSATRVDHRSDIYALGCILFELVCGDPPFDGEPGELIAKQQLVAPPTARSIVPDLPVGLDHLISLLLAKSPDHRPQSMTEVERALAAGGAAAPSVTTTEPPGLRPSRPSDFPLIANPTTLSSATGVSMELRRRNGAALLIIACSAAVVVIAATWLAMRPSGDDATAATAAPPPQPSPPPPVAPAPAPEPAPAAPPRTFELTAASAATRVQTVYAAEIKRCHDKHPQVHGTVELSLTVDASGDVTEHAVTGIDGELAACIDTTIATWAFPAEPHRPPVIASWSTKLVATAPPPAARVTAKKQPPAPPPPPPPRKRIGNGTLDPFADKGSDDR